MNPDDKKFLARTALILFIGGLTIPFLIAIFASEDIAMGFGMMTEVLALILGILSWNHTFGKIVSIGVGVLAIISVIQYFAFFQIKERSKTEMRKVMEEQEAKMQNKP